MTTQNQGRKHTLDRDPTRKPLALSVDPNGIPASLKALPRWICWRYEWAADRRAWSKIPLCVATGGRASSTDPGTWASYDDALSWYMDHADTLDGLGYVLVAEDGITGIDLDDALAEDGTLHPWAQEIVDDLDTYCEVSPSETGVKLWARGRKPGTACRRDYATGEVEMYSEGRYFAVTGQRYPDTPAEVRPAQEAIDRVYRLVFGGESPPPAPPAPARPASPFKGKPVLSRLTATGGGQRHPADLTDAELVDRANRCPLLGQRFAALWRGDTTGHGGDDSAADLALCNYLRFWAAGDMVRVDQLFRLSGLMRSKWDRPAGGGKNYGERTLAKAAEGDVWTPNNPHPNPKAWNKSQAADDVKAEEPPIFSPVSSADLDAETAKPRFLVKRLLVEGESGVIVGPEKSLKTSLAIDLAVSLGSGKPFLGVFDVYEPRRVLMVSGESGRFVIRTTAQRVCAAKGIALRDADVFWEFTLPSLCNQQHLDQLFDLIVRQKITVVIFDPLYLMLLTGSSIEASNFFQTGPLLAAITQTCLDAGATSLLIHHTNRPGAMKRDPLELSDIAYSGVSQHARQWLLVNHREAFAPGQPVRLWLKAGGSCGQSGLWAVDVDEGVLRDDFTGRKWDVTVAAATEEHQRRATQVAEQRNQKAEQRRQERDAAFLAALDALGGTATLRAIAGKMGSGYSATLSVADRLEAVHRVERCLGEQIRANNAKQTVTVYRRVADAVVL